MLKSKQEIPCFYLNVRVDMTEVFKLRARLNKNGNIKLSFNDFIIRAVAIGLKHYPIMTGQLAGNVIQLADRIDVGLAISTDEGLVAPLVRDCGGKTVRQIAEYSTGLIERARTNRLTLEDLEGGCITVSNLGGLGVDSFIPIVVPGQCSILGVGRIADTCMPIDGNIMVRKMMNLNLSVDHKVANGRRCGPVPRLYQETAGKSRDLRRVTWAVASPRPISATGSSASPFMPSRTEQLLHA